MIGECTAMKTIQTDILIVGTGASGLFAALHIPEDKKVLMITKEEVEKSDSFLAQGGICVLRDESDYDSFMEDTLKAGHYENRVESVDIMIRSSQDVIRELIDYGVISQRKTESLSTRERDATPNHGFYSTRTLRGRRLQESF